MNTKKTVDVLEFLTRCGLDEESARLLLLKEVDCCERMLMGDVNPMGQQKIVYSWVSESRLEISVRGFRRVIPDWLKKETFIHLDIHS